MKFVKHDAKKPRPELLPAEALMSVADVLAYGATKYQDDNNWRKCPAMSRYLGAVLRHLFAWARGEDADPESGRPHLAHAACCVLFLLQLTLDGVAKDDRSVAPKETT